jgi:hypothetical protein
MNPIDLPVIADDIAYRRALTQLAKKSKLADHLETLEGLEYFALALAIENYQLETNKTPETVVMVCTTVGNLRMEVRSEVGSAVGRGGRLSKTVHALAASYVVGLVDENAPARCVADAQLQAAWLKVRKPIQTSVHPVCCDDGTHGIVNPALTARDITCRSCAA